MTPRRATGIVGEEDRNGQPCYPQHLRAPIEKDCGEKGKGMSESLSTEKAAVAAANGAFYRAFAEGDFASMDALWAEREEVVCIHQIGRAHV